MSTGEHQSPSRQRDRRRSPARGGSSRPTEVLTQSRGVLGTRQRAPSGLPRPSQELCSNPDSVPVTEQALCCKLGVRRDPNIHPTHKGITPHGKQECRAPFHVKNMAFCVGNSAQHKGKRKGIVGKEDTSS